MLITCRCTARDQKIPTLADHRLHLVKARIDLELNVLSPVFQQKQPLYLSVQLLPPPAGLDTFIHHQETKKNNNINNNKILKEGNLTNLTNFL